MKVEMLDNGTGIEATFDDGAVVALTVTGLFPCSICKAAQCKHFHQALPEWNRFRWEVAESENCPWGPSLLQGIGIVPFTVDPSLTIKQSRHSPFSAGQEIAPSTLVWYTKHGHLYQFRNDGAIEGHVYVGDDHPDGHTDCLVCRNGCGHVARALALEERIKQ